MDRPSRSAKVYTGLLVVLVALRVVLYVLPVEFVLTDQEWVLSWPSIIVISLLGWIGVILAPRAGFAPMWDEGRGNWQRLLIPGLIGLGFGVLAVVLDIVQPLGGEIHISFPGSLVIYPIAGILEETIFRLFLTTLLVWLISVVLLRRRWEERVFWVIAVLLGLSYAFLQIGAYITMAEEVTLSVGMRSLVLVGAYFVVAAYVYRRYGFLAAVTMRMGDYLVWHIIWGA